MPGNLYREEREREKREREREREREKKSRCRVFPTTSLHFTLWTYSHVFAF
jgi:hypothetical protein